MEHYKNYKELMQQLSDEKVCRAFIEEMRWKGNPVCPYCGSSKPYKLGDGKNWRCRNKECKKDFSLTVKSLGADKVIPFRL